MAKKIVPKPVPTPTPRSKPTTGNLRQGVGQFAQNVGNFFGLPELGISERIAGAPTPRRYGFLAKQAPAQAPAPYQLGTRPGVRYSGPEEQARLRAFDAAQQSLGVTPLTSGVPAPSGSQTGQQAAPSGDFNNLLQPVPEQQGIDFDALIAPAIEGLEAAIAPLMAGTEATVGGIEAGRTTQIARSEADISGQVTGLERAKGRQEQIAESAADEARRQASQLMQGISSRYGRRGSAGIAASEILGSQAMRNIANIRQGLSDAMLQLDDKIQQVKEIGRIQVQDTEDRTRSSIAEARNRLDLNLADIRRQKGELQSNKAQLAMQAMQIFQNTVNNINAQNATFKQNLFVQQQKAENDLQLAMQKAQKIASNPQLAYQFLTDPITGQISVGNKATGAVTGATTQGLPPAYGGFYTADEEDLLNQAD